MEWLTELTNWLRQQLLDVWAAFAAFMHDLLISALQMFADFAAGIIEAIPVPDILTQYNLQTILGGAGPVIAWFFGVMRIGEGLGIVAACWAFRLLRKLLTLGQW